MIRSEPIGYAQTLCRRRLRALLPWALPIVLATCGDPGRPFGDAGDLVVTVAPLDLPGVGDARYTVTVRRGVEVVWSRSLTSSAYGDGAGSLAYVGPCDAGATNTVELVLEALLDGGGAEIAASSYANPTPITRAVACVANADTEVAFDLAIARAASQGFFDVGVEFRDIFCSAKLDCERDGADLELLHRPGGGPRDLTAVLGFSCASATGDPVHLYMDDLEIACEDLADPVRIDVSGLGNLDLGAGTSADPEGYLFGAAIARGAGELGATAYWNVSLGLDELGFADAGTCTLTARATASDTAFTASDGGFLLPAGTVYPVIGWAVELSDAGGRVCATHAVDVPGSDVATGYEGYLAAPNLLVWGDAPISLRCGYDAASRTLACGDPEEEPSVPLGPVVFYPTGSGRVGTLQSWVVPAAGTYRIAAYGAQGGSPRGDGGLGAHVAGDFVLALGDTLTIGVGQQGSPSQLVGSGGGGGGGGASFISRDATLLLAAGGGGGGTWGSGPGAAGLVTSDGGDTGGDGGGTAGDGGGVGLDQYGGSGGGGWLSAGQNAGTIGDAGQHSTGGDALSATALGGFGNQNPTGVAGDGGFGGGGGAKRSTSYVRGGGGGGYSGGQGSGNTSGVGAGGGGSYNAGANPAATAGVRSGAGLVTITPLVP